MVIHTAYAEIPTDHRPMRAFIAQPQAAGKYPGILCYSDIFQLTGPMLRACARLAGYGVVVAAPEIYHRHEPPGLGVAFDDAGRRRGLDDAAKTSVSDFDADCRAALDFLTQNESVAADRLGACGFCIGGHLAFRASFRPDVKATVCFYGTGIHDGKLGKEMNAGSLERAAEIKGELLLVWGTRDPHIPDKARLRIRERLGDVGVRFSERFYEAEHAFTRDEGPRYDPEATDQAFSEMISVFRRVFGRDT